MTRIVIIEDEKLTANDLRQTIIDIDANYQVVAMLKSVSEATNFFNNNTNYDLIFSDIQLSDGTCFDIFKNSKISKPVIFCTAYDEYALKAFKTNGIEYLLKPFNSPSVEMALKKYHSLRDNFLNSQQDFINSFESNNQELETASPTSSILANKADKIIPININDIAVIYLDQRHVLALTFNNQQYALSQRLATIIKLCGTQFFRANRQFLVNRKAIKNVSRELNRKLIINLNIEFKQQITVGKLKKSTFINWMANV